MSSFFMLHILLLLSLFAYPSHQTFLQPVESTTWKSGAIQEVKFDPIPNTEGYIELVREDNTLVGPGKLYKFSFNTGSFFFPLFFSGTTYKARLFLCPDRYCTNGKGGTIENPYVMSDLFTVQEEKLPLVGTTWYGLLKQGRDCEKDGRGIEGRPMSLKWNNASALIQIGTDQAHVITYWRPTYIQTNFQANYRGELYCFYIDLNGNFRWSLNASFCPTISDQAQECMPTLSSAELSRDPYQYQWNPIPQRGEFTGGLQMVRNTLIDGCATDSKDIVDEGAILVLDKWNLQITTMDPNEPNLNMLYIHAVNNRPGLYYGVQEDTRLLRCFNISQSNVLELQLRAGGNCSDEVLQAAPQCLHSTVTIRFIPHDFAVYKFPGWGIFLIISFLMLVAGVISAAVYLYYKNWRNRNTYEVFTANTKNYWTTTPDYSTGYQS